MQWKYIINPLFGAVIGYVTNWIAIKMLFRPLTEKRIMGIRIPFTPGVIPRERERIAVSVGEAVGDYLLTEQQITRTLLERQTEVSFRRFIRLKLYRAVNSELTVKEVLTGINGIDEELLAEIIEKISVQISTIATSENTRATITKYLEYLLQEFFASTIAETISDENLNLYSEKLKGILNDLLHSKQVDNIVKGYIKNRLGSLLEKDSCLSEYVPSQVIAEVENLLTLQGPELIKVLRQYLHTPEIRLIMIRRMNQFIDSHLGNRFLSLIADVAKKNSEKLTEKVYEILNNFLLDEKLQRELVHFLKQLLHSLLHTRINILAQRLQLGVESKRQELVNWIYQQFTQGNKIETLVKHLEDYLKNHRNMTWQEVLGNSYLPEQKVNNFLSGLVDKVLTGPGLKELIQNAVSCRIRLLTEYKIRELTKKISNRQVFQLTELIVLNGQLLIPKYIPVFLKTIDIKSMVQKSVDNLDVSQVENVLLGVTKTELTYVTWFGALLGLLIGAMQLLF